MTREFSQTIRLKYGLAGWLLLLGGIVVLAVPQAATAASATDDLFDISQGAEVVTHTGTHDGSDVRNMFGGDFGTLPAEAGNTLFRDGAAAGTIHTVEWRTTTPVELESITLHARHDPPPRDANYRGIRSFKLYVQNSSGEFELIHEYGPPPNPYGEGADGNILEHSATLSNITGQRFRAEFEQYGDVRPTASGPNIIELDGFGTALPAEPRLVPVTDDAWDISQGTTILDHSGVTTQHGGSDIRDMFGGTFWDYEKDFGQTDFADNKPAGFVHYVEWQTPEEMTLERFHLFANHDDQIEDGVPRDANERGFSRFTLFAKDTGGAWQQLYEYHPTNPYGGGDPPAFNELTLNIALEDSVTTDEFRAEFEQYGPASPLHSGPRIEELDGFGPEDTGGTGEHSNVAFIPGFQGSRLYRVDESGDEDKLWIPTVNQDAEQLFLDEAGESLDPNIYTRDIIDRTKLFFTVYEDFITFMDTDMVAAGVINEWRPLPYDWRLPVDEVAALPGMQQQIDELAASSATGKVTLVAHSNGGLVAKLMLNNPGIAAKVDRLIMVGTPQLGTPKALLGLLHGDEQTLGFGVFLNRHTARELGENMPGAYGLLPSAAYFDAVADPVVQFTDDVANIYDFRSLYGDAIDSPAELSQFLLGDNGGRSKPTENDTDTPNVLNEALLNHAQSLHTALENWTPPAGVEVTQIAGWGVDTVYAVEYDDCDFCPFGQSLSNLDHKAEITIDGDETVVIPSATAASGSVYFVNLRDYNRGLTRNKKHSNIVEAEPVREIVKKNIVGDVAVLPDHVSSTIPDGSNVDGYRLRMKSPVAVSVRDSSNRHTGLIPNPDPESDLQLYEEAIPNSSYFELGEKKYLSLDVEDTYTAELVGEGSGTFTFEIDTVRGDDVVNTVAYQNIPVAIGLGGVLTLSPDATDDSELRLDLDGDGTVDAILSPNEPLSLLDSVEVFQRAAADVGGSLAFQRSIDKKIQSIRQTARYGRTSLIERILRSLDSLVTLESEEPDGISQEDALALREIIAAMLESL